MKINKTKKEEASKIKNRQQLGKMLKWRMKLTKGCNLEYGTIKRISQCHLATPFTLSFFYLGS